MAAIQQIQNLIALSQPIPPDLQIAALLEAQQQGLSSNALAGVFGVPESMIGGAVSALGLSSQLSPKLGGTLIPVEDKKDGLFTNILAAGDIVGSLNGLNINTGSGATAPIMNQGNGYQSPYALNVSGESDLSTDDAAKIAGTTYKTINTGKQTLDALNAYNAATSVSEATTALKGVQGGIGSLISAIGGKESAKESVVLNALSLNPATAPFALAYRIFDAMDFFGGGRLKATPMTAEERADYEAQQKLDFVSNMANLTGEGSDALLSEAIAAAEARGLSVDSLLSDLGSEYADLSNTLRTDDGFVAGNAPVFTTGDTQVKNVGDEYYDQFTPEQIAEMRAANAAVLDVPLNVAQGALMGTEMLTNVAGADNVASQTLGEWQDVLGGMMSEQSKLDKAEISRIMSEAEGTGAWNEIKAAAEAFGVAPIDFVSNALGTTLPVIAATAVSGGGILPATVVGAATGVGTAKGAIYDATKQEMLNQGMTEEQANQIASDAQSYGGENLGEILISGGFGALAGSTGVEASVSRILQGLGKGGAATVIKGAAGEGLGEFGEGGAEQYATNKALQELGLDVTDFQGVIGNATLESLAGANTGGGISAIEAAGEGGTEGIADTGNNLQLVKDFNEAYNRNLESLSNNAELLTTTGLENELTSNTLGSEITGLEDTSGAATRDLNTSPKNINEVTEAEINEFESALEEVGLTGETTQTTQTTQTTAQQSGNKVAALSSVSNKAIALFGAGAAAIAAVVYAANKSGASAAEVAEATNMTVDQVNKLASEAGQTINNQAINTLTITGEADTAAQTASANQATVTQGGATVDVGADTVNTLVGDTLTKTKGSTLVDSGSTVDSSSTADTSSTVNNTAASTVTSSVTAAASTAANTGGDVNTAVSSAITSSVASTINAAASTAVTTGSSVTSAVTSASTAAVSTAITTAATTGASVNTAASTAVASSVTASINSGVAANTAITSAVNTAINSGASVNVAVNAAVNAAVNSGVNVNTATNIATNAATNVNTNTNVNVNPNVNVNTLTNINQEVPDPEKEKKQGMMQFIASTPLTDSILFEPKFTKLDNIPIGMFERFMRATGGR
jgi:hypothetical protein